MLAMVFFIDEARSRPPPLLIDECQKENGFFNEGFPKGTEQLRLYSFVAPPRIYLMMSLFRLGGDLPHLLLGGGLYPGSFREVKFRKI